MVQSLKNVGTMHLGLLFRLTLELISEIFDEYEGKNISIDELIVFMNPWKNQMEIEVKLL